MREKEKMTMIQVLDLGFRALAPGHHYHRCSTKCHNGIAKMRFVISVLLFLVFVLFGGLQKQKQYFVKYKGLAHFHNHWVLETQLLLEAPLLVSKFNRKNQVKVMNWREEWRVPHCFLKKRLLTSPKQQDDHHNEHAGDSSNCHNEWLVKWCGLDYEHATCELENASFLHSPQAQNLIREYENRHQRAKEAASFAIVDKVPLVTEYAKSSYLLSSLSCLNFFHCIIYVHLVT
ncbi:hypothetical protein LOK49_LG04G03367 [Camellia lanceoleosa]|uniref:Uncharacterized protein n=1 Tax=Camellia lanceoleosa TaxID=1840588 RepID=A0ACC0I409_9ERIC|nr:hypothetical protein LOK49_LG04G03367 [Camellia lanceoleosa]